MVHGLTGDVMIVNGYAKSYMYAGDGTLMVQVRIPNIHGPVDQKEYIGKSVRSYVRDEDLPFYPSLLLPHLPVDGEVVALLSRNDKSSEFVVIGLTGGSYYNNITNVGG